MPELPEVQTTVNGLNRHIRDLKIVNVWTDYGSTFHKGKDSIKDPVYFKYFKKEVVGTKILRVDRKAKNILIHIEKMASGKSATRKSVILIHMKMTGHLLVGRFVRSPRHEKFSWTPAADERVALHDPFNRFIHFVITLSNSKHIALSDMRKFAKVTLIAEKDLEKTVHLEHIGPDPLDKGFTFAVFKERLGRRPTGRIKTALMDQELIAGIGNIYSDEALWRAGIHPEERIKNIPDALLKKLYTATITVLKKGIDFGGDSMSDYRNIYGKRGRFQEQHQAYQKTGQPCSMRIGGLPAGKAGKRCKGIILRKIVGGRSAHFCSVHQRLSGKRKPDDRLIPML